MRWRGKLYKMVGTNKERGVMQNIGSKWDRVGMKRTSGTYEMWQKVGAGVPGDCSDPQ